MKKIIAPLVSVVVTTYNRKELLKETIDSILDQTYKNFELIVVDNYSNYDFMIYIKSFNDGRIRAYQNQNEGIIAVNRNFGIKKSEGEYIAFCDDDDIWKPLKLEKQIKVFENNQKGIVAVGTRIKPTDDTLKIVIPAKEDAIIQYEDLFYSKSTALSSLVVHINNNFFFNEDDDFIAVEDYEFQIRLLKETGGKLLILKDELVIYRIANSKVSSDIKKYSNILNVIELHKTFLSNKIFNDSMYISFLKVGVKALKIQVPAKIYFIKSIKYTHLSISKCSISILLLFLSILPNYMIKTILTYLYNKRLIINQAYSNLS